MIGDLLSAGAKLIGGFMGNNAQKEANQANAQAAADNIKFQNQYAQHAITWKVRDAEEAGVHPLYALGASTPSFSPVTVGASPVNSMANAMAGMGQDISRAVSAPASQGDKVNGVMMAQQTASNALDLETKSLQNQVLRAKLATMTQPGTPPGVAFVVPEDKKITENPKLMFGGRRIDTAPDTSPAEAFEKRYGDDGPVSWLSSLGIAARDFEYNMGNPNTWPGRIAQWGAQQLWQDFQNEKRNFKRFFNRERR